MTDGTPTTAREGLRVEGLEVRYSNAIMALSGVSLTVPDGGFVAVLGANGAGKTTLVRAITGLLSLHNGKPRLGDIHYAGKNITHATPRTIVRLGIGQVPEGRMIFPTLTVDENLRAGAASRSRGPEVDADIEEMYDLFPQLTGRRRDYAGWLSGGEQQMLAVGRAMMSRPQLLICDELSLGLAPLVIKELFELLAQRNKEAGTSILAIEQNARVALNAADYGYVLETGRIAIEGPSDELLADHHVQDFYLGGAGEAKEAYEAVVRRFSGRRSET